MFPLISGNSTIYMRQMIGTLSVSYRIYSVTNVVFLTKNMTDIECCFPALLSERLKGKLSGLVFFS